MDQKDGENIEKQVLEPSKKVTKDIEKTKTVTSSSLLNKKKKKRTTIII